MDVEQDLKEEIPAVGQQYLGNPVVNWLMDSVRFAYSSQTAHPADPPRGSAEETNSPESREVADSDLNICSSASDKSPDLRHNQPISQKKWSSAELLEAVKQPDFGIYRGPTQQVSGKSSTDFFSSSLGYLSSLFSSSAKDLQTTKLPQTGLNQRQIGEIIVRLEYGDITDSKADVIVNSTGRGLNLSAGKLSSQLLAKGGMGLQIECNGLIPLAKNNVVQTTGHQLNCKAVYHCRFSPKRNLKKAVEDIIGRCLMMASSGGHASIALPALETGALGCSHREVVSATIPAIIEFCVTSKKKPTTIRSIDVVLLTKNEFITQLFSSNFQNYEEEASRYWSQTNVEQQSIGATERAESKDDGVQDDAAVSQCLKSALPDEWTPPLDRSQEIEIEKESEEWNSVEQSFHQTFKGEATVVKIVRVQNPRAYEHYDIQKNHVTMSLKKEGATCPKKYAVERTLWHGTSKDSVSKINHSFFDRGLAGQNGMQYGAGCYFSTTSHYSDGYSSKHYRYGTTFCMIRAKVLTGEYCLGSPAMKTAPYKHRGHNEQYDSVVNSVSDPTIFVVFQDSSAYPEYDVHYRK